MGKLSITGRFCAGITSRRGVAVAIALGFVGLAALTVLHAANWDEFRFLSFVYDYADGRPVQVLQTFHVHLFAWLTHLPGNELSDIIAARGAMLGLVGLTSLCLWRMARALAGPGAAGVAVLAFLASGYVMGHGASFRTDPLAAALLMAALCLLATTRLGAVQMIGAALATAVAVLVTIKSALYAPAFLAVLLLRADQRGMVLRILGAGVTAVGFAAALYLLHKHMLVPVPDAGSSSSALGSALGKTVLSQHFLPRKGYVLLWAVMSLPALALVWAGLRAPLGGRRRLVLILLALPVASVLVYRNAFPYFFPFIVPPMMVVAGVGAGRLRPAALTVTVLAMVVSGAAQGLLSAREGPAGQRVTLAEVHRLFPHPVPYISGTEIISRFPDAGFFMSSWGMEGYRAAGRPVLAEAIAQKAPPLLIADRTVLAQALEGAAPDGRGLLPEDVAALRATYVHDWGVIWLAGRDLVLSGTDQHVTLPIPGRYRVEAPGPVTVNGTPVAPGETIDLPPGGVTLSGPPEMKLRLIWATAPAPAPGPLPDAPLYYGFWSL